ncbi:MAG: VWA domain-containing protein [Oligosphaeraceae bacterium]
MGRRLPVYLLLDVSGSMMGEPITAVQNGVQTLVSALNGDPQALESAYLSVITFSNSAQQVVPLTELNQFVPPQLQASGMTSLGEALALVTDCAEREVVKNTPEAKGDWKPLVFLMTDGCATDDINRGLQRFKTRKWGIVVACAAGSGADTDELSKITEAVVKLDTADSASIAAFFKWVSASVSTSSKSIGAQNKQPNSLDQLPDPPEEIQLI